LVSTSAVPGREVVARGTASARGGVNLAAALLQRLGLDDTRLCEVRPVFTLASRSSCGDRGPDAGKGGFIGVGQTLSGAASISAMPGRPINAAAPYVDQAPATLAALTERERSGTGQKISAAWCVALR
jgi:crotonobetainyl-CoA:carnitine CoA-transferase CaiB-like acyl-CoA transferase